MTPRVLPTEIFLDLDEVEDPVDLRRRAAAALAVREEDIFGVQVMRRSLDARKGRRIGYSLGLEVALGAAPIPAARPEIPRIATRERMVVVGAGPAGTFAALR